MASSRMTTRPSRLHDVLGYLQWEYNKIRLLTMLPSARFHYKASNNSGKEVQRGAATAAFCFAAIYGLDGTRRTLSIDGKRARSHCITRYVNPLRKIKEAFDRTGTLPNRVKFKEEDCADEGTHMRSLLRTCYITDVLLGWYQRVMKVMEMKLNGHNGDRLMSSTQCVPETRLMQAAWDWCHAKVIGHRRAHTLGKGNVPNAMQFFIKCVDEIPRADDTSADPGGWRFTRDVNREVRPTTDAAGTQDDSRARGPDPSAAPTQPTSPTDSPNPSSDSNDTRTPEVERLAVDGNHNTQRQEREQPPLPCHPQSGAQDSSAVAGVDLMCMLLANIRLVRSVPACFKESWARANTKVYKWVMSSTPGTPEHDNALFWELLLHRMLLRKAPRGDKSGRDSMAARFHAFETGDYQYLVKSLATICKRVGINNGSGRPLDKNNTLNQVMRLLSKGRFSKAFRLLDSNGLASMTDPGVIRQLDAKHGPRVRPLPNALPEGLPTKVKFEDKKFRETYTRLKPLSGTGPDGYRNEFIRALSAGMSCTVAAQAIHLHKTFAEQFVNADLPPWYYWVACAVDMVALIKSLSSQPGGTPDVRPIGMGGCKRRAWTSRLFRDSDVAFKKTFWPVQVAVGVKAGVQKLYMASQEHMRAHPSHVLLKLDFTNAYNTVWRAAVLKACYDEPKWRHLYRFFFATLSPKSIIKGINRLSEEGMQQGDVASAAGFCMALRRPAEWAHEQLRQHGGMGVFDMDDGYLIGPIENLMPIVQQFQERLKQNVGAVLKPSKCKLWCHPSMRNHVQAYLEANPSEFDMAKIKLDNGHTSYGVKVSGVPFGDKAYVQHMMRAKVAKVVSLIKKTTKRLQQDAAQNLYALLVQCMQCKLQFWMQCLPPDVLKQHLRKFDAAIMRAVRIATGQKFARNTLAYKRLRWPRRLMGGMIRSAVDVSTAAYVGGICLCVPSFTTSVDREGNKWDGILDHMQHVFGQGSFDHGSETKRFQAMLDNGNALSKQLSKLFMKMRAEVHGEEDLEHLPMDSPFKNGPAGAGVVSGKVSPRPQHEFTEWLERERVRQVFAKLEEKTNERGAILARDEAALLSVNEGSSVFVGVPTTVISGMDNVTYKECWASYLGEVSPVCAPWVGTAFSHFGGKRHSVVDKFGDNVTNAVLKGDTWRIRHDGFKWAIAQQASWCRFMLDTEPLNKFLPFIQNRDSFLSKRERQRQGMVPDFLDIDRQVLMDVKTMSFGSKYSSARFRHAKRCDAVRLRADAVHKSMHAKAKRLDTAFNDWNPSSGTPGPVQQRLQGFGRIMGLAVGAHGEFSKDLHFFIKRMAKQGAQSRFRDMGFNSSSEACGAVKQQVLLALGIEAVKGMARMRVSRLGIILGGNVSSKDKARRQAAAKKFFEQQADAYASRHCFYDI